jgi:uncharacterized protein YcfL
MLRSEEAKAKKPWIAIAGAAAALSLVLAGCAIQPPAETTAAIDREQLQVDPEVNYFVAVTELLSQRIVQPGGETLLQIQYAIDARSNGDLAWKVTWFDSNGMVVKGVGESYRKVSLLTGLTRYFTATAPHARVTDYQLHLREPQQ